MTRSAERTALAALLGCAVIASGNGVGVRFSNRELAPLWGAFLRFALAALLLAAVMVALRAALPRGRALAGAVLFGVLNFAGGFGLVYVALVDVQAGFGTVVMGLVPLVTLLLAVAWRQERFHPGALVGVTLAGGGIGLMFRSALDGSVPLVALVILLVGVVSLAQAAVVVRRFPPVHPVVMNTVGLSAGALVLLVASFAFGEERQVPELPATWAALGYLVLAGSGLLYVLYLVMLRHWDASRASYVFVLSPVGAVVLSAWLDGEPITASLVIGGAAALVGVYFGALRPRQRVDAPRGVG